MDGVVNELPVPSETPPVGTSNQRRFVPGVPVAPSVTVPGLHLEPGVVVSTSGLLTLIVIVG
jgi:hypothetical protein